MTVEIIEVRKSTLTVGGREFIVPVHVTDRKNDLPYGHRAGPAWGDDEPAVGYCEIYQRVPLVWDETLGDAVPDPAYADSPGLWFALHESGGGSSRSIGHATQEGAIIDLLDTVTHFLTFWQDKVLWKENGDRTLPSRNDPYPRQVIRCNGHHYTIGKEPASGHYRTRDMLGHAGAEFRFRLLDTQELIVSHNVWYQGRIPYDFRGLLPDNAETTGATTPARPGWTQAY
jgi:hypothetical protein